MDYAVTPCAIVARLSCSNLQRGRAWFETLLGRPPDAEPVPGLLEWRYSGGGGFQLSENPMSAGRGSLTVVVEAVREARAHLAKAGLLPFEVEETDDAAIVRLKDTDGNLVVLTQGQPEPPALPAG